MDKKYESTDWRWIVGTQVVSQTYCDDCGELVDLNDDKYVVLGADLPGRPSGIDVHLHFACFERMTLFQLLSLLSAIVYDGGGVATPIRSYYDNRGGVDE